MKLLSKSFYLRDSLTVAADLVGKLLVRESAEGRLVCRIVETEAYNQEDPASHSFRGRTARTAPMFEAGGVAYVYFIYGMYDCFNVVTDRSGYGSAVLIRAAEPLAGIEIMWRNRYPGREMPDGRFPTSLTNGPGKLARALAIRRSTDNGKDLQSGDLTIWEDGFQTAGRIERDVRVGISTAVDLPWRFYLSENSWVSRKSAADRQRLRDRRGG